MSELTTCGWLKNNCCVDQQFSRGYVRWQIPLIVTITKKFVPTTLHWCPLLCPTSDQAWPFADHVPRSRQAVCKPCSPITPFAPPWPGEDKARPCSPRYPGTIQANTTPESYSGKHVVVARILGYDSYYSGVLPQYKARDFKRISIILYYNISTASKLAKYSITRQDYRQCWVEKQAT